MQVTEGKTHLVKVVVTLQQYFYLFQNKKEYLVLWEGYGKEDASWILEEDITEAALL